MTHAQDQSKRVWGLQVLAVQLLLTIRMLRASMLMARIIWRVRPEVGSKFDLTYRCLVHFDSTDRFRLPRMEEPHG